MRVKMRVDGGEGKREAEKSEKNSLPFVFLSLWRRLVLKRWSQKFSFGCEFFLILKPLLQHTQKHKRTRRKL
jgi:hypothetical protein